MNIKLLLTLSCSIAFVESFSQQTVITMIPNIPFERDNNYSVEYQELIRFYKEVAEVSELVRVDEVGVTDSGYPLHTVVVSDYKQETPQTANSKNKLIVFINNGIHPGEPCGIDASMIFVRDLVVGAIDQNVLNNVVFVIVPVYNIGGMLNRGSFSRANQNGPAEYGFRANARNYDLNRDFIKADTENTRSFHRIFNYWNPHVFIDTHTSNGADYQYIMTLITTQKDKLPSPMKEFLQEKMLPHLFEAMLKDGFEMTPYVNSRGIPDNGIVEFLDTPRYSTGYTALHHCYGFMTEAHMLKTFKERVYATLSFIKAVASFCNSNKDEIIQSKKEAIQEYLKANEVPIRWEFAKDKADTITFKGYRADYKKSAVTGYDRLFYDRSQPKTMKIPYYHHYESSLNITTPTAYIIPKKEKQLINRLIDNGVYVETLMREKIVEVEVYKITSYQSSNTVYEGHFPHNGVEVKTELKQKLLESGDYIINTWQDKKRFIIETLEPQAHDSYFTWNFFDSYLSQKEYFSAYVFEDLAEELLKTDPLLKEKFEHAISSDEQLRSNPQKQLEFIYVNSPYYESETHRVYPIYRFFGDIHQLTE